MNAAAVRPHMIRFVSFVWQDATDQIGPVITRLMDIIGAGALIGSLTAMLMIVWDARGDIQTIAFTGMVYFLCCASIMRGIRPETPFWGFTTSISLMFLIPYAVVTVSFGYRADHLILAILQDGQQLAFIAGVILAGWLLQMILNAFTAIPDEGGIRFSIRQVKETVGLTDGEIALQNLSKLCVKHAFWGTLVTLVSLVILGLLAIKTNLGPIVVLSFVPTAYMLYQLHKGGELEDQLKENILVRLYEEGIDYKQFQKTSEQYFADRYNPTKSEKLWLGLCFTLMIILCLLTAISLEFTLVSALTPTKIEVERFFLATVISAGMMIVAAVYQKRFKKKIIERAEAAQ